MFLTRLLKPSTVAYAHCDLPCGVYDPEQARIEAESCYKIIEKYNASSDDTFKMRALVIKEERAELAKHHIDVLWSDYFKPEHTQKYPEIQDLCWKAAKQCSKVKASVDVNDAKALLDMIDKIDDIWTKAGGPQATRVAKAAAAH
jgi:nickel superoxide dismutase